MACTLAGLASQCGLPASILSNQAHEENIHYRWDRLVLSSKRTDYGQWHRDCSHLVWFDVQRAKLEQAMRSGCVNIFVPLWQRLTPDQLAWLPYFDHVVCSHRAVYNLLKTVTTAATYQPWDTGLPFTGGTMPSETRRIFVPFDSWTLKNAGGPLLTSLRILLDGDQDTVLTISYNCNCGPHAANALAELLRRFPRRVRVLRKPNHAERVEAYLRHDWTFIPSLRENVGLVAHEALCCRKPVVVFDVPPNRELLPRDCASFVPCGERCNSLGVPEAVPNMQQLADHLRGLVEQPAILQALAQKPWPWLESDRSLNYVKWRQLWNLI